MRTKTYRIQDIYPIFRADHDSVEDDITKELSKLKFFCGQASSTKNCCFSHKIGLPKHPANNQEMKFMRRGKNDHVVGHWQMLLK